jgi:hypothetical protein
MERRDACDHPRKPVIRFAEKIEAELLAGLLTVNKDEAPGRPPGIPSAFTLDRRAAASS